MRFLTAADVDAALSFPALVDALARAFRSEIVTPARAHHTVQRTGAAEATLLLMPAWTGADTRAADGFIGTKIVSVVPDNPAKRKPSIVGIYVLFSTDTAEPLCVMDGPRLTLWRTAAASALAASKLARADASRLLMVGAGALAPYMIRAHASVRPIREVAIWNRSRAPAETLAASLVDAEHLDGADDMAVRVVDDLEAAVRDADIVSCATMSSTPLVHGAWLKPGAHLDLVGAYRPTMRECDDEAVRRASLFCDTRAGATTEGGDLAGPIARGVIGAADVKGDLFDLSRGTHPGRAREDEITLFKSVGTAIEDLAAAMLVWRSTTR
jgi:ornithine cyclodeaminase